MMFSDKLLIHKGQRKRNISSSLLHARKREVDVRDMAIGLKRRLESDDICLRLRYARQSNRRARAVERKMADRYPMGRGGSLEVAYQAIRKVRRALDRLDHRHLVIERASGRFEGGYGAIVLWLNRKSRR